MIKIIPARWQLLLVQPRMGHFVTFLRLEQISAIHQLQCKVGAVNCREIQAWCKEQYREIQSTTALYSETQLSAVNIQKNAFSGPESACIIIIVLFDKSVLATVFFCIEIKLALTLLRSFATKT